MKKAFTLVEIMAVIMIIGIIIAISLPNFSRLTITNNTAKAKADIKSLQMAVENFYLYNKSAYPLALANLTTTVPTIVRSIPIDPFSSTKAVYRYNRSPNAKYYAIYSVGPQKNGSAAVSDAGVLTESSGASCIYVSNIQEDTQP
jgi:prepilin-type N-terminal cleavage/methylation domain-containing protein